MQLTLSSLLGPGTPPPSPPAPAGETAGGAAFAYLLAQTLPAAPLPPAAPSARQPVAGGGKDLPEPVPEGSGNPEDEAGSDQAAMPLPQCDVLLPLARAVPQPAVDEERGGSSSAARLKPIASTMPQPVAVDDATIRSLKPIVSNRPERAGAEVAVLPTPIVSNSPQPLAEAKPADPAPPPAPITSNSPQPVKGENSRMPTIVRVPVGSSPVMEQRPAPLPTKPSAPEVTAGPTPQVASVPLPSVDRAAPNVAAEIKPVGSVDVPSPVLDVSAAELPPADKPLPKQTQTRVEVERPPVVSRDAIATVLASPAPVAAVPSPSAPTKIAIAVATEAPSAMPPVREVAPRPTTSLRADQPAVARKVTTIAAPAPSGPAVPARFRAVVEAAPVMPVDVRAVAPAAPVPTAVTPADARAVVQAAPVPTPVTPADARVTVQATPMPTLVAPADVRATVPAAPVVPVDLRATMSAAPTPTPAAPADAGPEGKAEAIAASTPSAPPLAAQAPATAPPAPEFTLRHVRAARSADDADDVDTAAKPLADASAPRDFASVAAPVPAASAGSDPQPREQGASLHREAAWAERMMGRIEEARDVSDATDRRIRITPDALGTVDVHVRREGDAVQVQLTAEHAATRALLAEAAPRLNEWTGGRPLQFTGGHADGGSSQRQAPQPQAERPAPRAARAAPDTLTTTDHRIA